MILAFLYLGLAIFTEIIGTTLLKASAGFTKLPLFFLGLGIFSLALFFMTLSFKIIPLSIGYAIWSGVGTAGAALIGLLIWEERLTITNYLGMIIIVLGVILLNIPFTER